MHDPPQVQDQIRPIKGCVPLPLGWLPPTAWHQVIVNSYGRSEIAHIEHYLGLLLVHKVEGHRCCHCGGTICLLLRVQCSSRSISNSLCPFGLPPGAWASTILIVPTPRMLWMVIIGCYFFFDAATTLLRLPRICSRWFSNWCSLLLSARGKMEYRDAIDNVAIALCSTGMFSGTMLMPSLAVDSLNRDEGMPSAKGVGRVRPIPSFFVGWTHWRCAWAY